MKSHKLRTRLIGLCIAVLASIAPTASFAARPPPSDMGAQPDLMRAPRPVLSPPPPGPPPDGLRFEPPATYGIFARVAWNPGANATAYEVARANRDDAACCNATSGLLPANATSWGDAGLYRPGYYRYTVTAHYADGSVGSNAVDLLIQQGASPAPVVVQDLAPGRVRLTWNLAVPGTSGVRIIGPGFGQATEKLVIGGGPVDLTLPAGTYTWKVAGVYDASRLPVPVPNPVWSGSAYGGTYVVLSPPTEWAEVSHTVGIRSERYRVSFERFKAGGDVQEDLLRSDGRGNEIYLAALVADYGLNGVRSQRMVRTPTFGDVWNFPNRIQAGSASPQGGIRANDEYPPAVQFVSQLATASTTNLPFVLWEGDLSETEGVLILSPSIWEADEDDRLFAQFSTYQIISVPNLPSRPYLAPYFPDARSGNPAIDTWRPTIGNDCRLSDRLQLQGGGGDQPIDGSNLTYPYCPKYVAINWRLASSTTSVNPAQVLEVPVRMDSPPYAEWKLFVRIEKVASTATIAPMRPRPRPFAQ